VRPGFFSEWIHYPLAVAAMLEQIIDPPATEIGLV
jgi:hypothetical protein